MAQRNESLKRTITRIRRSIIAIVVSAAAAMTFVSLNRLDNTSNFLSGLFHTTPVVSETSSS